MSNNPEDKPLKRSNSRFINEEDEEKESETKMYRPQFGVVEDEKN